MTLYTLENSNLRLQAWAQGGAIEGLWWQHQGEMSPVLRPGLKSGIAVESSCFPLVPFGNRVSISCNLTLSGTAITFTAMAG